MLQKKRDKLKLTQEHFGFSAGQWQQGAHVVMERISETVKKRFQCSLSEGVKWTETGSLAARYRNATSDGISRVTAARASTNSGISASAALKT